MPTALVARAHGAPSDSSCTREAPPGAGVDSTPTGGSMPSWEQGMTTSDSTLHLQSGSPRVHPTHGLRTSPHRSPRRGRTPWRDRTPALTAHPMTCPYVTRVLARPRRPSGSTPATSSSSPRAATPCAAQGTSSPTAVPGARHPARPSLACTTANGVQAFARTLEQLSTWLRERAATEARLETDLNAASGSDGCFAYPTPPRPGGLFVLSGP